MKKLAILVIGVALLMTTAPVLAKGGPNYTQPGLDSPKRGNSNMGQMLLVEKDAAWVIVGRDQGGAFGKVKYNVSGDTLDMNIQAHKLDPNDVYQVEIEVDGSTIYCVAAGVPTDSAGNLNYSLSLNDFSENPACVVPLFWFDAATSFVSDQTYSIKVWVKDDDLPAGPDGTNYQYRLWEYLPLSFTAM